MHIKNTSVVKMVLPGICLLTVLLSSCFDEAVPPPMIVNITPNSVLFGMETEATISGENFDGPNNGDLRVLIDEMQIELENTLYVDSQTIQIIIPAGLEIGSHDLTVVTANDLEATLIDALTVYADEESDTETDTDTETD